MTANWEYFDEERVGEFAVEGFDFDDEYDTLEPWEYDELRVVDELDGLVELVRRIEEATRTELAAFGCIEFEDDEPVPIRTIEELHAFLVARVDELTAELDESGVEDALGWSRWDEYEDALYSLAEFETFA